MDKYKMFDLLYKEIETYREKYGIDGDNYKKNLDGIICMVKLSIDALKNEKCVYPRIHAYFSSIIKMVEDIKECGVE